MVEEEVKEVEGRGEMPRGQLKVANMEAATLVAELVLRMGLHKFCLLLRSIQSGEPVPERPGVADLRATLKELPSQSGEIHVVYAAVMPDGTTPYLRLADGRIYYSEEKLQQAESKPVKRARKPHKPSPAKSPVKGKPAETGRQSGAKVKT